jgi:hypothetical protein
MAEIHRRIGRTVLADADGATLDPPIPTTMGDLVDLPPE